MSLRICEQDQSQAKYLCITHNEYFCKLHYKQHVSDRKPHIAFPIDNVLTQPDFEQLQIEVVKRIKAIEIAKKQVASQAAQLITTIEETCFNSIENLNSLIQSYRAYTAENNFDHQTLKNITKILTSRLKVQIDQDLALNIIEESEEEKKSIIKTPDKLPGMNPGVSPGMNPGMNPQHNPGFPANNPGLGRTTNPL
jgi:Txe/YoeB family toxin of Txe-Axe toxin-antitoxin module